jgi:hypothetical protein
MLDRLNRENLLRKIGKVPASTPVVLSMTIDSHDCGGALFHNGKLIKASRPYMIAGAEQQIIDAFNRGDTHVWADEGSGVNGYGWDILSLDHLRMRRDLNRLIPEMVDLINLADSLISKE